MKRIFVRLSLLPFILKRTVRQSAGCLHWDLGDAPAGRFPRVVPFACFGHILQYICALWDCGMEIQKLGVVFCAAQEEVLNPGAALH